jgi:hypothetical protein
MDTSGNIMPYRADITLMKVSNHRAAGEFTFNVSQSHYSANRMADDRV